MPAKTLISNVYPQSITRIDKKTISHPVVEKAPRIQNLSADDQVSGNEEKKEESGFEQISIFDDLND